VEIAEAIAHHLASVTTRFAAVARLEETIHTNELFAGALAHDLRNPLNAMMTAAQLALMLQEGEGTKRDQQTKPLSRILTSGERMSRMINQLLDLTLARSGGGIRIEPGEANLASICADAVAELELAHPAWRIDQHVRGDQHGVWDPDRLQQIISNVVANAGQHGTAEGRITVTLDGSAPEAVTIDVRNSGTVPAALRPVLFDPFRGARERRNRSSGLGLGLFIVRELVAAHGGDVALESSDADDTTTVSIRLPRRARASRADHGSTSR
jgi:signal transduction histidine kinase